MDAVGMTPYHEAYYINVITYLISIMYNFYSILSFFFVCVSDPDKLQIEAVTITFSFFQTHLNSGHVIDLVFSKGGGVPYGKCIIFLHRNHPFLSSIIPPYMQMSTNNPPHPPKKLKV